MLSEEFLCREHSGIEGRGSGRQRANVFYGLGGTLDGAEFQRQLILDSSGTCVHASGTCRQLRRQQDGVGMIIRGALNSSSPCSAQQQDVRGPWTGSGDVRAAVWPDGSEEELPHWFGKGLATPARQAMLTARETHDRALNVGIGVNFQGADLSGHLQPRGAIRSVSACQRECRRQVMCAAFTFITFRGRIMRRCWLKNSSFALFTQRSENTFSGIVRVNA
uniref:Apple domain-containing protein n=1 Tax=Haptolina ericina TaxID=156174 RepID=A0A7S3B5P3_9EUKA